MRYFFLLGIILIFPLCPALSYAHVLSGQDVSLYKEVFRLQDEGKISEAKTQEKKIKNPLLKGYVLYQRYFSSNYKTTKSEIKNWMEHYSDYPIASEVYALGNQKKVKNLPRPKGIFGGNINKYRENVEKVIINKKYIISCNKQE